MGLGRSGTSTPESWSPYNFRLSKMTRGSAAARGRCGGDGEVPHIISEAGGGRMQRAGAVGGGDGEVGGGGDGEVEGWRAARCGPVR